eukprot:CAMPEP_0204419040 /NCGR_PEP_ID=MMETSP0470-20130426/30662_1 /ASSEMBLY_ACC=CAM_ASM_000385 /TAXON_ID=2969 /ORGANISM="Oxyrrhis marina" /LENGTH=176 /DNA_ID=CAMNT_0051415849 /DNA_START=31 /DNA_END=561 /DNA_ORIENTATION=+
MVQSARSFQGAPVWRVRGSSTFGHGKQHISATTLGRCSPQGTAYYASSPFTGREEYRRLAKSASFGIGERKSFSVAADPTPLGAYDVQDHYTKKTTIRPVTLKSRCPEPASAQLGPGPARYNTQRRAGEDARGARIAGVPRTSRPQPSMMPSWQSSTMATPAMTSPLRLAASSSFS